MPVGGGMQGGRVGRLSVALASASVLGCVSRPVMRPKDRVFVPRTLFPTAALLRPEANPGSASTLRLGTTSGPRAKPTEFAVSLRYRRKDSKVTIDLLTSGERLEREVYETRPASFDAVEVGDQTFVPSLALLHYPVRTGDRWEWRGKVLYAGRSRDAHANVAVSNEGEDARCDVDLSVATNGGRATLRRPLTFVFRKGEGVVRRGFGDVSARRPLGEAWRP